MMILVKNPNDPITIPTHPMSLNINHILYQIKDLFFDPILQYSPKSNF
jgi:hypothetical protein